MADKQPEEKKADALKIDGKMEKQGKKRKYNAKNSKKKWGDQSSGKRPKTGVKRLGKKLYIALLFGYNGKGYQGLQINPGVRTIEEELEECLFRAGAIDEFNHKRLNKIAWTRCARTDKGVSAACQVVAAKLIPGKDESQFVERVNKELPKQMQLFRFFRVTRCFNAKNHCTSRTYTYILPTYCLEPEGDFKRRKLAMHSAKLWVAQMKERAAAEIVSEILKLLKKNLSIVEELETSNKSKTTSEPMEKENASNIKKEIINDHKIFSFLGDTLKETIIGKEKAGDLTDTVDFRISEAQRLKMKDLLSKYLGTKNHHNFTKGRKFTDASANRYIMKFEPVEIFESENREFMRIEIHGQSFMIHQIRKMIGLAILVARGQLSEDVYTIAFTDSCIHVPKAPALGLFLDRCHFRIYNRKVKTQQNRLDFEEATSSIEGKIKSFRSSEIIKPICETEIKDCEFARWIYANHRLPWGQVREDSKQLLNLSTRIMSAVLKLEDIKRLLKDLENRIQAMNISDQVKVDKQVKEETQALGVALSQSIDEEFKKQGLAI